VASLTEPPLVWAKPPDLPEDGTFTVKQAQSPPAATSEDLPMPREDADITCPYLRKQSIDRHVLQIADPGMNREVLENLERLKRADNLLELAKELASYGFSVEAIECCACAAELCPGSPCARRAEDTLLELALGIIAPLNSSEEAAEARTVEPGVEQMVYDLMKACHLLMTQGMQREASEIARQAYALDPESVQADPLVYKMHLLSNSPATRPAGSSESSEPSECPYCPRNGKPIGEILPNKKKTAVDGTWNRGLHATDCELEVGANDNGELRMSADCPLGGSVYHLRYAHGNMEIWKSTDAGKTKP
jgi:hypothetical protein